jgi:hypothetical protein
LICYSWITGISDVAFVVFVRKHQPEIQYLKAAISEEQRQEIGRLVETTVDQIEAGQFASHSGIRFPQNGCLSCCHLGFASTTSNSSIQISSAKQERATLIGLTSLWTDGLRWHRN